MKLELKGYNTLKFIPADSERKRSTIIIEADNKKSIITVGAMQVVEPLCRLSAKEKNVLQKEIEKAASQGYRIVAVAVRKGILLENNMSFIGIIALSDNPYEDAADEISFLHTEGINVKMVTGDNHLISQRIASKLNIQGQVMTLADLKKGDKTFLSKYFEETGVFAEMMPEDKYNIVCEAERNHMLAVTGDGVNDLPALKASNVSIAVSGAVDAVKSSADIVLLSKGLSVIKDAIIESRKIFARIYTYSVYRIAESFRVIWGIVFLGIMYGSFPLTPIQLILLALLNDVPIISLAFNKVRMDVKPAKVNAKKRIFASTLFGLIGLVNSILFVYLAKNVIGLDWGIVQTLFFLKLTLSGHLLIFVAHTRLRWFKFLPSKQVILATVTTQIIATIMAVLGIFMAAVPVALAVAVWVWAFFWMQISDVTKSLVKDDN